MPKIGIVTALKSEAQCLEAVRDSELIEIIVGGVGPGNAEQAARSLCKLNCTALISFGLAGALNPSLPLGSLILASRVLAKNDLEIKCSPGWSDRITRQISELSPATNVMAGDLFTAEAIVTSVFEKRSLFQNSGAIAVDMEASSVGQVAAERGLDFMAVKSISDTANQTLPDNLNDMVSPDGGVRPFRAVGKALSKPSSVRQFLKLAAGSKHAHRTLRRVAMLLGPAFGLDGA